MGYQGGLRLLTVILDKIFDELDQETMWEGVSYDLTR
jgi:nitrogenase molybdenum-iron protein beta chain